MPLCDKVTTCSARSFDALLLKTYVEKNGRPVAFYTDRASLFVNTPKNSAGEDPKTLPPTQIGRALEELGIESIAAYSPQAKAASTIEQANTYLESEFLPWWNATLRVTPAHPDEAHRELGPEHNLDSALSHVVTRRVANDYTIRFEGKHYQIDRKAIVPGLRGGQVRLESRLDGNLAARFGQHDLALRRCLRRSQSEDAKKQAAATPAEKAPRQAARRKGSDWMEGFDLKKSPSVWQAARASGTRRDEAPSRCAELAAAAQPKLHWVRRANGARRSSRCLSPRPQLRDFTKAILFANTAAAGSGPHGKAALTPSVTANGCALPTVKAGARPQLPAQQGGIGECSNTKPSDGEARGPCRSADCFGASPVASALGMESRRDPALHSQHFTIASLATRPRPDISTWQRIGHFYLALTFSALTDIIYSDELLN